ncbi:hypothetical protein [Nitrosomonas sp.]|uniref:hypothetical protein n=1 Tax=Nitrosomonas sp. TaxID=42353 RepID=UPI0020826EF6|nr:hypothetical protein [Nitrosomonas sp.]GJL76004.1 MAG: MoxR-like ATPase [Nitrosomonas sp.]
MTDCPKLENFFPKNLTISNPDKKLHHLFDEQDCYALWAAYSAGRPLLVRGKPGTGKSQLAKAIAEQLGWAFVSEVVRGSTELSDLHWHFDAIGRLGEAQARGAAGKSTSDGKPDSGDKSDDKPDTKDLSSQLDPLDPLNYLSPGVFWWAYDWKTAKQQHYACQSRLHPEPDRPATAGWQPETGGVVLLLDEIDKAEPDLPNGLLETLGQYQFGVPHINHTHPKYPVQNPITADPGRLLIVITTNEERELPTAFVRRCFVHTLKMEDSTELEDNMEKRIHWLAVRGKLHFGGNIAEDVYIQAAKLLWQDRAAGAHRRYPPGLAEYIDLLRVLPDLPHQEQRRRLEKIANFALSKDAGD